MDPCANFVSKLLAAAVIFGTMTDTADFIGCAAAGAESDAPDTPLR